MGTTNVTRMGWLMLGALLAVGCGPDSSAELGAGRGGADGTEESAASLAGAPEARVLDHQWQAQETSFWCGPGSTRIALSARKAPPSQGALARELGTTTNGTDHIGLVVNVLNRQLGVGHYSARTLHDPPTPAQVDGLKQSLVATISNGYALVANVVSGWRPPFYPGGTLYHYVAVVGYDQGGERALIADPAAGGAGGGGAWSRVPRTYWVSTRDLAVWIGGKGYAGTSLPIGPHSSRVGGAIGEKYRALGGPRSFLGEPLTVEQATPSRRGAFVVFQGGSLYWSAETGAWAVGGAIRDLYLAFDWERGVLGFPVSDERTTPDGAGRFNHFERGSIYWTQAGGAFEVHGDIRDKWAELGWERSALGYPVTNETAAPDGVGRFSHFQQGAIYWTPSLGAHALHGPLLRAWAEQGYERGALGYPTSDVEPTAGGARATFERGSLLLDGETGRVTVVQP